MHLWQSLNTGRSYSMYIEVIQNKGKNPRAQSSKTHKASTLTRMAQQHHHDSLSQHTSQIWAQIWAVLQYVL